MKKSNVEWIHTALVSGKAVHINVPAERLAKAMHLAIGLELAKPGSTLQVRLHGHVRAYFYEHGDACVVCLWVPVANASQSERRVAEFLAGMMELVDAETS